MIIDKEVSIYNIKQNNVLDLFYFIFFNRKSLQK